MAIDAVTAIASGTDDAIKLVLQKDAQANTPAEIAAKQAQQVQLQQEPQERPIEPVQQPQEVLASEVV